MGDADGIASLIDLVVVLSAANDADCRLKAKNYQDLFGGTLAETCLLVQWRFDVAADFHVDQFSTEGSLAPDDLVTAGGQQIHVGGITSGFPGTQDNGMTEMYAFGGPGTVVRWRTGSNAIGYSTFIYTVPPLEQLLPVFLPDGVDRL